MATAKKTAPKAAATLNSKAKAKVAKVVKAKPKPAVKTQAVSKTAKAIAKLSSSIAKLTERKNKLSADINALRDQRTAMKTAAVAAAPKDNAAVKAAAPAKTVKRAAKK